MFDSVFSVISIIVVVATFIFYCFIKQKDGKDWVYAVYFVVVLSIGAVFYSLALKRGYGADSPTLFIIAKAIGLSLKTFGGDFSDTLMISLAQDNLLTTIAIFVHYVAAMILTFLIAIKLFGKRIVNRLKVLKNSLCSKYIVVGASAKAQMFLNSLDAKTVKHTTVILDTTEDEKKKELMIKGFAVTIVKKAKNKKNLNSDSKYTVNEMKEALRIAGYLRNKRDTKIISMFDDDDKNLLIAKLVTDHICEMVKPVRNSKGRVTVDSEKEEILSKMQISAYIMYQHLERAEYFTFTEYALGRIKFFNPHELRARKFMLENPITSLIPKDWINNKKARLYNKAENKKERDYKIGNIFVGFGDSNRCIFRKSICNNQLLGIDYNALIIDKDNKNLQKQFKSSARGLFNNSADNALYFPSPQEKYNIAFEDLDVLTDEFYDKIVSEIAGNGDGGYDFACIVIALNSDKLSVEVALQLRQRLYSEGLIKDKDNKYDRVRIFVKALKESVFSDFDILNDMKSTVDENKALKNLKNLLKHERERLDLDSDIMVFGASNEILNEDYIIHEELDTIAKRIANNYWETAGAENQTTNVVTKWDSLTEFKREINRFAAMSIRTKLNLLGFDLMIKNGGTDIDTDNAYKDAYNIAICVEQRELKKKLEQGDRTARFVDFVERDDNGAIIDNARNNLARLEHQRWNAFHLSNGWTKLEMTEVNAFYRQNERSKKHACITTFEGLTQLRELQAKQTCQIAQNNGQDVNEELAKSYADTVCYDFDVMDYLPDNLKNSKYKIVANPDF